MALPVSVQTVTVHFGPFLDFLGAPLTGATTFEPSTAVRHEATGTPILSKPITVEWDADGMGTVILPATDSTGLNVTGFTYRVTHRVKTAGVKNPDAATISLPAAAPEVDLDLLVPTTASNGVVVAQPEVLSVAGLTGVVTGADLLTATGATTKPAVAADIGTSGTAIGDAARAAFVARRRDSRTIVLGNSIDAGGASWFAYLTVLSNQRVKFLRNAGVGGDTTAQMLARIQTDVIDHEPDICILGGPENDHSQGVAEATTRANYQAMFEALRAAGISVVARTAVPVDVAASAAPWNTITGRRQVTQRHNAWLARWAEANGIPLLDMYSPLVDPATGGYKNGGLGGTYTTDGLHPLELAHHAAAAAMVAAGVPAVFRGQVWLGIAVSDDSGLLANGNGVMITDATSDGKADGWDMNGHVSHSLITDSAIVGNWQQITGDGTNPVNFSQPIAAGKRVAGNRIYFACKVKTTGAGFRARVLQTGTTPVATDLGPFTRPIEGTVYVEAVQTASTSATTCYMTLWNGGTDMRVAQAVARDLTALEG